MKYAIRHTKEGKCCVTCGLYSDRSNLTRCLLFLDKCWGPAGRPGGDCPGLGIYELKKIGEIEDEN